MLRGGEGLTAPNLSQLTLCAAAERVLGWFMRGRKPINRLVYSGVGSIWLIGWIFGKQSSFYSFIFDRNKKNFQTLFKIKLRMGWCNNKRREGPACSGTPACCWDSIPNIASIIKAFFSWLLFLLIMKNRSLRTLTMVLIGSIYNGLFTELPHRFIRFSLKVFKLNTKFFKQN